ncbi:MAG: methyltransferase domain-containing protein [Rikenellaceae bacterium]
MKRLIHWLLNHIPRPLMQRVASISVPLMGLFYRGRGRECSICGSHWRRFMPYGYVVVREEALCPNCLSLERHRLLWLWLILHTNLLSGGLKILHIAPEVSIMKRLRKICGADYITADLESPLADMHFDVQQIPLADNSVDVILCNHILEHVEDDRLAMRELKRILKPNGWGVLLVPRDESRETTFEDDTITDSEERTRIFGQYDHRRVYGRDYADRLRNEGFVVDVIHYCNELRPIERIYYGVKDETIFRVSKLG